MSAAELREQRTAGQQIADSVFVISAFYKGIPVTAEDFDFAGGLDDSRRFVMSALVHALYRRDVERLAAVCAEASKEGEQR